MAKKKKTNTDITVIIPVHELNEQTTESLGNAIQSVADQFVRPHALMIVAPTSLKETLEAMDIGDIKGITTIVENTGETDFASQMNLGVEKATTEWVSLLEYDDEFSKIWLKNAIQYRDLYTDMDMFMPIIVDVNERGEFLGLSNEAVWAAEFCDEMGVLDEAALLAYQNFNFDGMVIKKETYQDMGGIKPSMKLTFIYEFLLRLTHASARIMIVPRFGYKHVNQRTGSMFHNYRTELEPAEASWWMQLAKKEYHYVEDRNITYETEK